MNYEEKYKQALSRATFYSGELLTENQRKILVDIFPELKESEDERMKKAIKHILYENYTDAAVIEGVEIAEIVTWLEEQGEQKNTRKREIDDAYLQGICGAKHEIEKQGKTDAQKKGGVICR